jgi:uncharacterized RmlC-like cupin family protein
MSSQPTCVVVRPGGGFSGKQGLSYVEGISAESVDATGLCMHLLRIPPAGRARAHLHESHETAIYVISGEAEMWLGENLAERLDVKAGELLYIPANTLHLPINTSDEPCVAVLARTDPIEQESVVLLPELDFVVPRKVLVLRQGERPGADTSFPRAR